MKKILPFALLLTLASCEIYLLEDPNAWDDRDLYVGSYHVEEYSQTTDQVFNYDISIQKSCCRSDEVKITNFYGSDIKVYGYISNSRLTIPLQQVNGIEVEGTGKINGGVLRITFFARDTYSRPAFTDFVDMEGWPY